MIMVFVIIFMVLVLVWSWTFFYLNSSKKIVEVSSQNQSSNSSPSSNPSTKNAIENSLNNATKNITGKSWEDCEYFRDLSQYMPATIEGYSNGYTSVPGSVSSGQATGLYISSSLKRKFNITMVSNGKNLWSGMREKLLSEAKEKNEVQVEILEKSENYYGGELLMWKQDTSVGAQTGVITWLNTYIPDYDLYIQLHIDSNSVKQSEIKDSYSRWFNAVCQPK